MNTADTILLSELLDFALERAIKRGKRDGNDGHQGKAAGAKCEENESLSSASHRRQKVDPLVAGFERVRGREGAAKRDGNEEKESEIMGKLQNLAARAPAVIAQLEKRADVLDARLTKLEGRGNETFDKWENHLTAQDRAVTEAENAINQLSNSGPLDDSPNVPEVAATSVSFPAGQAATTKS